MIVWGGGRLPRDVKHCPAMTNLLDSEASGIIGAFGISADEMST